MRPALALLLAAVLAVASGCTSSGTTSSGDFKGSEKQVADVVDDLSTAARDDDPQTACRKVLASSVTRKLGANCAKTMQDAFDDADALSFSVKSVRVTGTTARARVASGRNDQEKDVVELVKEPAGWRVTNISPLKG